jgi:hypothetical protein
MIPLGPRGMLVPLLVVLLSLLCPVFANQYISYTDPQGTALLLDDDRQPALYTTDFGDCLGKAKSAISVSRFDASLYMDNMTVAFHIAGTTNLTKESVMGMHLFKLPSTLLTAASVYRCLCLRRDPIRTFVESMRNVHDLVLYAFLYIAC